MESKAMRVAGEVLTDSVYALRRHNMQAYRAVMRVAESGLVEAYWVARSWFLAVICLSGAAVHRNHYGSFHFVSLICRIVAVSPH